MSKNKNRRDCGVHLGYGDRKRIREYLLSVYGNKCYWCKKPMIIPVKGLRIHRNRIKNMATIEHYFAKKAGKPNDIDWLILAHKKCNR